jgi:hypothetical protein
MGVAGLLNGLAGMPLAVGLALVVLFGAGAMAVSVMRGYYRLAHVPGPKAMGYTNLVMAAKMYGGRMHYEMLDMMKKYGSSQSIVLGV